MTELQKISIGTESLLSRAFLLLVLSLFLSGCGSDTEEVVPVVAVTPEEDEKVKKERVQAIAHSRSMTEDFPRPLIRLPKIDGWTRSRLQPLDPEDHGYTISYEHHFGISVTLYQYRRKYDSISESLDDPVVTKEMDRAKERVHEAVKMDYWQSANETGSGITELGQSKQKSLWSRFVLAVENGALTSDIYVWSYKNSFFQLRCTTSSQHSELEQEILGELLTAIGEACK